MDCFALLTMMGCVAPTLSLSLSLSLGLLFLALLLPTPVAHADSAHSLKDNPSPQITISSNKINFSIPNLEPGGVAQTDTETITITTDNPTGYATTLSTNSIETCLRRPSDGTSCSTAAKTLTPVAGTLTSPSLMSLSYLMPNQWGATLNTVFLHSDPSLDEAWFAIPDKNSNPSVIKSSLVAVPTGDTFSLTIGAKSDYTLPTTVTSDKYQNTIVITATANQYDLTSPVITTLSPNFSVANESKTITITGTSLNTAYQVFVDLNSDGIQDTGEACANANITDPNSTNTTITCDTPTVATLGVYDVVVKTWGGTAKASFTFKNAMPAVPTLSPASNALVDPGTTAITLTSSGAVCTWGTNAATATANASGATHTTAAGTNTLYYSCIAGTGSTASEARTGNWSYLGAIMQNITKANCPTTIKAVIDNRDQHYYYVQKMADGNCWMLTNLAYSGAAAGIQFISGSGSFDSDPCVLSSTVWCAHTSPADNARQWVDPTSSDITGDHCATAYRASATALNYTECGYFYNWCAALGNAYNSCDAYTALSAPANAGVGLCPSGWRLPTGGSPGEYAILNVKMVDPSYSPHIPPLEDEINSPLYYSNWSPTSKWHGVYGGLFYPGSGLVNNGLAGYYWTATIYARPMAYGHRIMTNQVSAGWMETMKSWGYAVRCVAV